jgi:hypothetical protein
MVQEVGEARGRTTQLKPSKWPLRMRSPMGDGALRGRPSAALSVAARRGDRPCATSRSRPNGVVCVGLTAVFGGALGGERFPSVGLMKPVLRESRRKSPWPRSLWASGMAVVGFCVKRPATAVLARRACETAGRSFWSASSSSNTGGAPNLRNGKVPGVLVGDWAKK